MTAGMADNTDKSGIRHIEKRRISTCTFADRIAEAALEVYRATIDNEPHPTCIAAILLYDSTNDELRVVALGVGTKFLAERVLQNERTNERPYGRRVRDMHAEVLCRRSLRRLLSETILADVRGEVKSSMKILERISHDRWRIREGYTLHAYFSSTPCGNATVKKFATLSKEKFRPELSLWPNERHSPQAGHSIHLGQFALLLKKDATASIHNDDSTDVAVGLAQPQGGKRNLSHDNIPYGTTSVHTKQGSLHTCSDKVCRWNCLGWQGSLLSSFFTEPLHMQSITVGRKFSSVCFRRAVCCRISPDSPKPQRYRVHHPSVMCTSVYVDDGAMIATPQNDSDGMQFSNTLAYAWWPSLTKAQAIDSNTGFAIDQNDPESPICTKKLTEICQLIQRELRDDQQTTTSLPETLEELRILKVATSPNYEATKDHILRHKVMKTWNRRSHQPNNV